ncbi:transcription factor VIP1 [Diospyros lotus]|uniref:transcription factor VIP1 n=1 Tax=Diospyros lotus TaxID=55363 RepID=UPI002255FADE|nr:transcription factor VIP1 [Diospyros lotus]
MEQKFAGKAIAVGRTDIEQMPDTPNRRAHHRRAQSETFFRFPDDILLEDVVSEFDLATLDVPSLSSDTENNAAMAVDSTKPDAESSKSVPTLHFRSFSVGADFFDGLDFSSGGGEAERLGGKPPSGGQQQLHRRHRHSNSMDGSTTSFEADSSLLDGMKKAMGPDRLAELALIDPKRAKRILANRQSAARSKERKIRYTNELERKVQTLQTEATTLSAQVTMLQRDTSGLTTENKELKLRLQAMEQQAHLRDALNEALREEVQRLKIAAGQIQAANGNPFNRALPPQYCSQPQMFQHFNTNQSGQPQQQQQQQVQVSQSTTNNQTPSPQSRPSFMDFNQRVQ